MRRPSRESVPGRRARHSFQGKRREGAGAPPGKRRAKLLPVAVPRDPWRVPTRWLKAVAAVLLLPVCWVASRAFFDEFPRAALTHQFWRGEEF